MRILLNSGEFRTDKGESMSDTAKVPFGHSLSGRAIAVILAFASSLLLAYLLITSLPAKNSGWEKALPTLGMFAADTEAALLRARYLHEAAVRPELIKAGFFSVDDAVERWNPHRRNRGNEPSSATLTAALWTFRALPALHDMFLSSLLDVNTPPQERAKDFYSYGELLASIADSIADGRKNRHSTNAYKRELSGNIAEWFAYFVNAPRMKSREAHGGRRDHRSPEHAKTSELFAERLAFARAVLPEILTYLKKDDKTRAALARRENNNANSSGKESFDNENYLEDLNRSIAEALRILWEKRADPSFTAMVREIVASNKGSLQERYDLIPLVAKQPGMPISEYFFWQQYKSDLASVTACVGTDPVHYVYMLGCMDKLMTETINQLKSRGTFILSGHSGPGVTITSTDTLTPGKNISGKLYLLVDMAQVIKKKGMPEYDLSRAYPIFRGMLYRHMERQPLILPLDPSSPKDAALIKWYAQTGWEEDRSLLFSALGSPGDVARHWGLLHLLWWENDHAEKADAPALGYLHPESGHFMAGLLPTLKGKAVTRFLGPITALWFGVRNATEAGWSDEKYKALPETPPAVPTPARAPLRSPILEWLTNAEQEATERTPFHSEATATILIDGDIRSALDKSFSRNSRIRYAFDLDKKYHDPTMPPQTVLDFVASCLKELDKWGVERRENVSLALEYLWRFRGDVKVSTQIRDILSQKNMRPHERMRKLRQLPVLTEKKGELL